MAAFNSRLVLFMLLVLFATLASVEVQGSLKRGSYSVTDILRRGVAPPPRPRPTEPPTYVNNGPAICIRPPMASACNDPNPPARQLANIPCCAGSYCDTRFSRLNPATRGNHGVCKSNPSTNDIPHSVRQRVMNV